MPSVHDVLAEDDQVIEKVSDALHAAVTGHVFERDLPFLAVVGDVLDLYPRYLSHAPMVGEGGLGRLGFGQVRSLR